MLLQIKTLRIIFFGTGKFAAYHLYTLINCSSHKICAIFTQEKQSKSAKPITLSIIKIAQAYNLPIFQTRSISKSDIYLIVKKFNIDIIIVVSYGLILPKIILDTPKLGCINVHASLLPRWRGAAPIQRALEHGDTITGISIIRMHTKLDSGNILYIKKCQISSQDTTYTLSKKLAYLGSTSLIKTIEKIILGICDNIPQNYIHTSYAHKINKLEARINWKDSSEKLERCIRAFNPWPISYFKIQKRTIRVWQAKTHYNNLKNNNYLSSNSNTIFSPGTILKTNSQGIYVATGSGIIILTILQIPGKKKKPVKDLLNSYQSWFAVNSVLK